MIILIPMIDRLLGLINAWDTFSMKQIWNFWVVNWWFNHTTRIASMKIVTSSNIKEVGINNFCLVLKYYKWDLNCKSSVLEIKLHYMWWNHTILFWYYLVMEIYNKSSFGELSLQIQYDNFHLTFSRACLFLFILISKDI